MDVLRQKWLYSGKRGFSRTKVAVLKKKVIVFGQSGCIRAKEVAFGQKWLYSDKLLYSVKSCCTRAKLGLFGQSGCIRQKYSYTTTLSRIQPFFPNVPTYSRIQPLLPD